MGTAWGSARGDAVLRSTWLRPGWSGNWEGPRGERCALAQSPGRDRLPSSGSSATSLKVGLRHGRAASPERLSQGRQAEAASLGAAAARG